MTRVILRSRHKVAAVCAYFNGDQTRIYVQGVHLGSNVTGSEVLLMFWDAEKKKWPSGK